MKKVLSLILVIIALFGLTVISQAAVSEDYGVMPCYNNTINANASFTISSSGKVTVSLTCNGEPDVASRIEATTKIERKFGLIWVDVDGGEWSDTALSDHLSKTHTLQLSKKGTYRATIDYRVFGSGGTSDQIQFVKQATY